MNDKDQHSKKIRVVIADDHEVFRDGFNSMLSRQKDIELVGEAENGKDLLLIVEAEHPDVVVTDIKMPGMDGIEATRILAKKFPSAQVIALSMFDDDDLIVDMLEAGASGYLLKNAHKSEIVEAIKTVHNHIPYYCAHTTNKLAQLIALSKFDPQKKKILPHFTPKETEVILLVCEGYSNKEIAIKMDISVRTVEGHRENINEKMEVNNTAGVVVFAIRYGIYKI